MSALAIEVRGLVKRFEDVVAVDGIDLDVPPGQCVGLLGPNGAGKTTTVEILEWLQPPTGGSVRVLGRSWDRHAEEIRARIGVQLQETRFHERLTLEEKRKTWVSKLSGGQRQRLALAVALVSDPELLFLDEPTTGLDPQARRALWSVIESLKGQGRTVVLTTHYMEEAAHLCDRVVIVDRGRIVADGTPAALVASLGGSQLIELVSRPGLEEGAFAEVPGVASARRRGDAMTLSVDALHRALPAVLAVVSARGAALEALSTRQATLDDVFLHITGHSLREEAST